LDRSSAVADEKLTLVRWGLVNVLSTLATNPDSSKQTLSSINIDVWCALSSWFLKYHLSSLYHERFYWLVKEITNARHEQALNMLFVTCDFLTKIIGFYKSSIPGSKAHTHLIANLLKESCNKPEEVADPLSQQKQSIPSNQTQAKAPSGKKKGKGHKGARGKNKGGKPGSKDNKLQSGDIDFIESKGGTHTPIPFFKYLSTHPTWSVFVEEINTEEAEQRKTALPINRYVPDTNTLTGFLS